MEKIPVRHIKSNIKEPDASGGLIIRSLNELLSGNDMVQELHRHSFYFILIVTKGTGRHIIDFTSYQVVDRSIFIMRPGQVHELMLKKDAEGFLLEFPPDFHIHSDTATKQLLRKVSLQNYFLPDDLSSQKLLSLMETILREASDKREMYSYAIQKYLQLLLVELLRLEYASADVPANHYLQTQLEEFQELIADHFSVHKQVSWYAEKMHMTPYQLNAMAKATLGKTSLTIITDYILLEAKRYLLATSNQINQIAWYLGYEDVSYFIRFFKKQTGYSPEVFRNNFK